jgi:hypothetical protein
MTGSERSGAELSGVGNLLTRYARRLCQDGQGQLLISLHILRDGGVEGAIHCETSVQASGSAAACVCTSG